MCCVCCSATRQLSHYDFLLLLPLLLLQLAAAGTVPHIFSLCFGFPTGGALLLGKQKVLHNQHRIISARLG
jgi:hypothetical protein